MNHFKEGMKRRFKMKDLGRISLFLGIDFNQSRGVIKMNQKRYILKMLNRMEDCKPRATPCEQKLGGNSDLMADPKRYREIVGCRICDDMYKTRCKLDR